MDADALGPGVMPKQSESLSYTGSIIYEDGSGSIRGRERFIIGQNGDGRILLARCEIYDRAVARIVSYRASSGFEPIHSYVEVSRDNSQFSHGLFSFAKGRARLEDAYGSHQIECGKLDFFGAHPLVMDGWITAHKLRSEVWEIGESKSLYGMTSSVTHDGASDPGLHLIEVDARKEGTELVWVEGKQIQCNVITLKFGEEYRDPHPAYTMWISDDQHQLFIKGAVQEFDRYYKLETLPDFAL
ncbi:MAG: hypothetical protein QNI84_15700 [Henriciella sp.]|nr:hypothetical protein [Henriciella sp.]